MFDDILANFALHVDLSPAEAALVVTALQVAAIKKNGSLLQAGHTCRSLYFVNKGCLRVFNRDEEGREHNLLFCPENWWAADIASFSSQLPAFYNISALEDTEVICISHPALEQLFREVPKLERFFRILMQNGFSLYQRRINSNLSRSAEERYAMFRRQYPKLEQRIAQKHTASYLGITPVFLSMIRKKNLF